MNNPLSQISTETLLQELANRNFHSVQNDAMSLVSTIITQTVEDCDSLEKATKLIEQFKNLKIDAQILNLETFIVDQEIEIGVVHVPVLEHINFSVNISTADNQKKENQSKFDAMLKETQQSFDELKQRVNEYKIQKFVDNNWNPDEYDQFVNAMLLKLKNQMSSDSVSVEFSRDQQPKDRMFSEIITVTVRWNKYESVQSFEILSFYEIGKRVKNAVKELKLVNDHLGVQAIKILTELPLDDCHRIQKSLEFLVKL